MTYTIHHSNGTQTRYADTRADAMRQIAEQYGCAVSDLVTDECEGRELVWLDEASAQNDDGAHAVCEVTVR